MVNKFELEKELEKTKHMNALVLARLVCSGCWFWLMMSVSGEKVTRWRTVCARFFDFN